MDEIREHKPWIEGFCSRWKIREFAVFGSVVRGEMRPDSDLDVLVTFCSEVEWDLIDMLHMQDELEALFRRKVDLVERQAIETSDNWIVRNEILGTAAPIYARD